MNRADGERARSRPRPVRTPTVTLVDDLVGDGALRQLPVPHGADRARG